MHWSPSNHKIFGFKWTLHLFNHTVEVQLALRKLCFISFNLHLFMRGHHLLVLPLCWCLGNDNSFRLATPPSEHYASYLMLLIKNLSKTHPFRKHMPFPSVITTADFLSVREGMYSTLGKIMTRYFTHCFGRATAFSLYMRVVVE